MGRANFSRRRVQMGITEVIQTVSCKRGLGVRSLQDLPRGDIMKRTAAVLLLLVFSLSFALTLPAQAQRMTPEQNARQSRKAAKKQQKMLKKMNKRQRKAAKRADKAGRKAAKKANRSYRG